MQKNGQIENPSRDDLERELMGLPLGCIAAKTIKGVKRYYRQWVEDGHTRSEYLAASEVDGVRRQIERRREIVKTLRRMGGGRGATALPGVVGSRVPRDRDALPGILTGAALLRWTEPVAAWQARTVLRDILKFLRGKSEGRVALVYGLRRTGKTTLLQQAVRALTPAQRAKAAYFKVRDGESLDVAAKKLDQLSAAGFRYVFVDEVTLAKDFIDGASLFSDIYAMSGMKIVLSGTDSLGFWMSIHQELFDRAYLFHTSLVPFAEYSRLLDVDDIDEYIRYGGLLKRGYEDFDDPRAHEPDASFRDEESTRLYIDTAIARNIQHSLACCREGHYFRHLRELYEADELTSAINRVIEDMNREFLVSVITREFKSSDLGIAKNAMRSDRDPKRRRILSDMIDVESVTKEMMRYLDIRNVNRQRIKATQDHVEEIREYLEKLDLVVDCPIRHVARGRELSPTPYALFTQPGMRYCQAEALVKAMMKDRRFARFASEERTYVTGRVLENVRGRMLEDIVLLETIHGGYGHAGRVPLPNGALGDRPLPGVVGSRVPRDREVFKLMFDSGEFDMVVRDPDANVCELYEIKHSREAVDEQFRHLTDRAKCAAVEKLYGRIASCTVLYRGPDFDHAQGIRYRNVETYLQSQTPVGSRVPRDRRNSLSGKSLDNKQTNKETVT